jgi:homoserine kinase
MGSSAASAAAAAWAVNGLFGAPLTKAQLIPAGLESEAFVSGYHADNIGPALMGGFVLIRCALGRCSGGQQLALQVSSTHVQAVDPCS